MVLLANLECKSTKNETFSHILQKVKTYFMPISIILRLIPTKFQYKNIENAKKIDLIIFKLARV
jgi:hypothetical protein